MFYVEKLVGLTRYWLDISNEWVTNKRNAWKYQDADAAHQDAELFGGYVVIAH